MKLSQEIISNELVELSLKYPKIFSLLAPPSGKIKLKISISEIVINFIIIETGNISFD